MKKNLLSSFILITMFVAFALPFFVSAETGLNPPSTESGKNPPSGSSMKIVIANPFKASTIEELIKVLIKEILIPVGGVVAVLMVMWAGFLYVTARGKPDQITKAHKALLWAVVGAAILLGAWVISDAVGATIKQLKV